MRWSDKSCIAFKAWLKRTGRTGILAATEMEVSQFQISRFKNGRVPSDEFVGIFCRTYGFNTAQMIFYMEEEPGKREKWQRINKYRARIIDRANLRITRRQQNAKLSNHSQPK